MYGTTVGSRKRTWWITTVFLAITLMIGMNAQSAAAQATPLPGDPVVVDPTSCGHFETQADAQAAFDSGDLPDPENLDWDGDGIACEEAFDEDYNEPVVVDCGHFETREEAVEAIERGNVAYPEDLDPDGDGIVCEDRWGEVDEASVVVDPTSCGHFVSQESAREAFDSGNLPHPENLDADGDGIVCEFRWGEVETDDSESITDSEVVALPVTGTGSAAADETRAVLIAILSVVSIAGTLQLRTRLLR